MARQGVLKRAVFAALLFAAAPARAQTDEPDELLHHPERLTVEPADELGGQLSPDGSTLYFVSNRNAMTEIFAQDVADGRAKLLFDDDADVTSPRVSPDGQKLAYISFGHSAVGQLCVRSLPAGKERRCLESPAAVLQAEWIDRSHVVVVSRESIKSDLRVLEVDVGASVSARPLLDRNLTGIAVSPDGQWLVYVPIQRTASTVVGPAFASHGGERLEAIRLTRPSDPATTLVIDLPGLTGQPAFSRDGRAIYFTQFLDDSNHDGLVDASDGGVLFRVPFSNGAVGAPEQLTATSYDCQYPAPAAARLIATCARGRSLAIYALPLDGEVPSTWGVDQLDAASDAAGTKSELQLLAGRRMLLATTTSGRRLALLDLVRRYLDLDYYRAAEVYADRVSDLRDRSTLGLSRAVLALVAQRRAERDRERGVMVQDFREQARDRLNELRLPDNASPAAIALGHVVRSAIADSIGDKTLARSELEAVSFDANAPAPVVELYYERADALYRELDDRDALVAACRRLSESAALGPDKQLRYARAAVRAMVRGLPRADVAARLDREHVDATSELAFAIELARVLLPMRDAHADTGPILALYARHVRADRRSAIVDDAVRRAREVGASHVVESLAKRYLDDSRPGTRERLYAARLFRRVMTGSALGHAASGQTNEARADFDAVVKETGSYESAVAAIDLRLKAGEPPAVIGAAYASPAALSDFAKAYVIARQLPNLREDDATRATSNALALVHASWAELRNQRMAIALDGALLHEQYVLTGDLAFAERANVQYVIALESTRRQSTSFRALILGLLGTLHEQLGNWRMALDYLRERDTLPYADDAAGLGVRLAFTRALLHANREADAARAADAALAAVDRTPELAPYRILVLDRAAVCNLAAGRFARALVLYDAQIPSLDRATGPSAIRNRFVARVGRAAAAVGAGQQAIALSELDAVEHELDDPKRAEALAPDASTVRTYRLIANGLRAKAFRDLGRLDDEARAIDARRALLAEQLATTHRTEYELALMLAETQLALNAAERRDRAMAASWLRQAFGHADNLRARAHGAIDRPQLDVLWAGAQLSVSMGSPLVPGLASRMKAALDAIAAQPDLRSYQRRFEMFLPILK